MKLLTLFATVVAAVAAQGPGAIFTNCAPLGTTDQNVTNFTVSTPFCPGHNFTLAWTGPILATIIEPVKLAIGGKFLGRTIYTDNKDLCALLADAGTPCPITTTVSSLSIQNLLKSSLPTNVNFQFTFQATNGNNRLLFCQTGTLSAQKC